MSKIKELSNVPDISFIENETLEGLKNKWLEDYQTKYAELTGETKDLPLADPVRLIGYATTLIGYQMLQYIDRAGKVNLLKYAYGEYLDNLAALKGLFRRPATGATTILRYTISAPRAGATGIPGGSRARDEDGNVFATDFYAEIPSNAEYVDIPATALTPGVEANNLPAETINLFVDPLPYIQSVTNITVTSGGDAEESDDDLTYRVLMHPTSYSVAGPKEAYEYWAKTFRADISDVRVFTPAPTEVTVLFMLKDGVTPDTTIRNQLEEFLKSSAIRPLTDKVTVTVPRDIPYNISLTYYINKSDARTAESIQEAVSEAINSYLTWQRQIGRDINPSELIKRITAAGAKRVELLQPSYVKISDMEIAKFYNTEQIIYGGLEDD